MRTDRGFRHWKYNQQRQHQRANARALKRRYIPEATIGSGLEVLPSRIPNAGNGLFATRVFANNSLITLYEGNVIDKAEADRRQSQGQAHYIRSAVKQHKYIDSLRDPEQAHGRGGASFVNDGTEWGWNNSTFETKFCQKQARDILFLKATKEILPGEEIFASYGRDYWIWARGVETKST